MLLIVAGIAVILGGVVVAINIIREENNHPSDFLYGLGYIFGCFAGTLIGLIGLVLVLIGMLLRK